MLKLAWRNLWRNYTRTLIIGSAIAFSYAMMLISMSISEDTHGKMREAAEKAAGGSILINGAGWWESQASDVVVARPGEVEGAARGVAGVREVVPRVVINGLASSALGNEPIRLSGIEPGKEFLLDDLSRKLVDGEFFGTTYESPIVLSETLAKKLQVGLGDKVVLTASTPGGEVTRALFMLSGVLHSGVAGEAASLAYTTVGAAQAAVGMDGEVTQLGVLLASGAEQDVVVGRLREVLAARVNAGVDGLEVLTWQEEIPEMKGLLDFDEAFGYIYMIVIFIIVLLAIANTFLMAVMERVREYGLLNAIGLTPWRIGTLVVWESVLLGVMAMVVGFALGFGVHLIIAHVGIDLASFGMGDVDMAGVGLADLVIRSRVPVVKWVVGSVCVFVVVMVSAIYPALRAMRLAPAQAMRFYE